MSDTFLSNPSRTNVSSIPKIRCAIYDRVSTELQAREGLSLEAQRQALTDYALAKDYEIVDYYADEGITARKKMQNRRDLLRLLRDVEADKIDLILVTKLDRWFRNIKDYHNTQAILEAHHCNWKTIFEEYDTSTANGRFAINIMLSVNENECDRTSDRIHSIFAYKKSRKEHLNGRPAYGYAADPGKKLIKDPAREPIVNDIFAYYFATCSKKATVQYITEKYADSPYCPTVYQIARILSSGTYTGRMYGIDDYCPAYITSDQYRRIRSVPDLKTIPRQTEPFLFSSMIRCPVCGRYLGGFTKHAQLKSGGKAAYKRYRCCAKYPERHGGACLSEATVESYLLEQLAQLHSSFSVKLILHPRPPLQKPDRAAGIRAELERLNRMYQKGRIQETYYEQQYACLSARLENVVSDENPFPLSESSGSPSEVFFHSWQELYRALDIRHKRAFWRELLLEINVDKATHKLSGLQFRE